MTGARRETTLCAMLVSAINLLAFTLMLVAFIFPALYALRYASLCVIPDATA